MLTADGRRVVEDVARRHGFGTDAVLALLMALLEGHGAQAQFSHPEFGGMGQWSQGGMIMIGDMFNHGLMARVDALCNELAGLVASTDLIAQPRIGQTQSQSQGGARVSLFVPGARLAGNWWPPELGTPASVGAQNDLRYAFFPASRRLAIDIAGRVTVYDTGDHAISGVSQQQSGDQSVTFTSQHGLVRVADLAVVGATPAAPPAAEPAPATPPAAARMPPAGAATAKPASGDDDVLAKIERLADLRQRNILTEEEYQAKKAELLDRL